MHSTIEVRAASKWYGQVKAVAGVSFSASDGACLCLLGPSGCGKTTTLRMVAGLENPDEGKILIRGLDVTHEPPYARDIGMVFQDYALFPHMTVFENVAFGLRHRGVASSEIPKKVAASLELVQLTGLEARKPSQLSGGQQQRVALARALATRPAVLLLDEPLSNLDAKLREELRTQLKQILIDAQTTTILVTHDQDEAMALADEVVVMRDGRVEQRGAPISVYDRPATKFVADFFGQANWIKGSVVGQRADSGLAMFRASNGGEFLVASEAPPSGEYQLCIRPQNLRAVSSDAKADQQNLVCGTVRIAELRGSQTLLHVGLQDGAVMQALMGRDRETPRAGDSICFTFNPQDAQLIAAG